MKHPEPVLSFSIPAKTTVRIVRDNFLPCIPDVDSHIMGVFNIKAIGNFFFHVYSYGMPGAQMLILSEDENKLFVQFKIGDDPALDFDESAPDKPYQRDEKKVFLIKTFLVAWHARLGHISGYKDKPVPYPLPSDLQVDVSCKPS